MKQLFVKNPSLQGRKVVIYGADSQSVCLFSALLQNEIYVDCFCDPEGKHTHLKIMNKAVRTLDEIKKEKDAVFLIIGGLQHVSAADELEREGFEVYYDFNLASDEGNSVLLQGEEP